MYTAVFAQLQEGIMSVMDNIDAILSKIFIGMQLENRSKSQPRDFENSWAHATFVTWFYWAH